MTNPTDTRAFQALADKVEAGEFPADVSARDLGLENCSEGLPIIKTMYAAFSGSLDAAKALHEAVLPGWDLQICTYEDDLFEVSVSMPTAVKTYDGLSEIISRAWLLAIIRALIAGGRE